MEIYIKISKQTAFFSPLRIMVCWSAMRNRNPNKGRNEPHLPKWARPKDKSLHRELIGTNWGANKQTLKMVYNGERKPHLDYCLAAWPTIANTHLQSLDKVDNQALRIITGAIKSPFTGDAESH